MNRVSPVNSYLSTIKTLSYAQSQHWLSKTLRLMQCEDRQNCTCLFSLHSALRTNPKRGQGSLSLHHTSSSLLKTTSMSSAQGRESLPLSHHSLCDKFHSLAESTHDSFRATKFYRGQITGKCRQRGLSGSVEAGGPSQEALRSLRGRAGPVQGKRSSPNCSTSIISSWGQQAFRADINITKRD